MRIAMLSPLALTLFLAFPQARADDEPDAPPPKQAVSDDVWEAHAKTFDLDGDGKITWEEYQKVTSGFAFLDADKDGAITRADLDALGGRLAGCADGGHAAMFLGTPQGGLRQLFGGSSVEDAEGALRLLPFLLGLGSGPGAWGGARCGGGGPGLPWTGGPAGGAWGVPGMPFGAGPWSGPGAAGWPGAGNGRFGGPGCGSWTGMEVLPWLRGEAGPAHGGASEDRIPAALKRLVVFGVVAQRADGDGDRQITREEWAAGVRKLTKEDGSLDLSGVEESVGIAGLPFPGGGGAGLQTLLDVNGDHRVDAGDLEGVFETLDADGDGRVTEQELAERGVGALLGR